MKSKALSARCWPASGRSIRCFNDDAPTPTVNLVGPVRPPRIVFDNNSSETCTIIDIFARNRLGLLYAITGALFDLGLSVQLAKISTYGEMVVDVFYVTCENGKLLMMPTYYIPSSRNYNAAWRILTTWD